MAPLITQIKRQITQIKGDGFCERLLKEVIPHGKEGSGEKERGA